MPTVIYLELPSLPKLVRGLSSLGFDMQFPPKPKGHFIEDRKTEVVLGIIIAIIGMYLLWDSFDNRGKKMPWPASGLAPW